MIKPNPFIVFALKETLLRIQPHFNNILIRIDPLVIYCPPLVDIKCCILLRTHWN
jgi:hypothetical protein